MVAVDGVDAHADEVLEQVVEVQVPREGEHLEAVIERDPPAAPVAMVEVDGVDAGSGEVSGVTLEAAGERVELGGVNEPDIGVGGPQCHQLVERRAAQPETT